MHIPLSSLAAPLARRFLGLPLAFATLFAGPALRAETQVAAALRAKVTPDVISKWSPDVRFHERERYFPSSAEELFKGATLFKVNPDNERSTGESKPIQSPSDLSKAGVEWRIRYDPKNPAVKQGSMTNGNVTAPMYVSVMVPNDASFVDIRYCFLFGFNGAQSMRSLSPIGHFNYTMGSLAEHDGDWEGFTVRLGPDLQEFIYGLTEAHGDGHKYTRPQMDFFEGTHPQIRLAYNSHGVYNGKGKNPNDWIVLTDQKLNQCIDIITRDGPVWRPWKAAPSSRPFRLIGRDSNGRQLGEPWANFGGRMGSARTNSAGGIAGIGGSLSGAQMAVALTESSLTGVVTLFKSELCTSAPCMGPGGRPEMNAEMAGLPPLAGQKRYTIKSKINTFPGVLSVSKTDNSTLVVEPLRPGDATQEWYWIDSGGGFFSMVNVGLNRCAAVEGRNQSRVFLAHRSIIDEFTTWSQGGGFPSWCALRPRWDNGQNLNVFGSGGWKSPARIGTFGWGGGKVNELWSFEALR